MGAGRVRNMPAAPYAGEYTVFADAQFLGHNAVVRGPVPSVGGVQLIGPTGRLASLIKFAYRKNNKSGSFS